MSSIIKKMLRKSTPPQSQPPATSSPQPGSANTASSGKPPNSPRILIIGGGSRGSAYARAIHLSTVGTVVGIAEPIEYKRNLFVSKYSIDALAENSFVFSSWTQIVETDEVKEKIKREVDGICICTLDETHTEV